MFSALRKDSVLYILDKGENPKLSIGKVVSCNKSAQTFGTQYQPVVLPGDGSTYDVSVSVDGNTLNFEKLPADMDIVTFPNKNIVISCTSDSMSNEIISLCNYSKRLIDQVDYHKRFISASDEMLKTLNPKYAKEKQQEEKISSLEEKIGGIENSIKSMQDMLSNALNTKTK